MIPEIESSQAAITELCRRYGVRRLDVFGSATRSDFDADSSDVDFAVEFDAADNGLARYFSLKSQMESLLNRRVDLVELSAMADSRLKRIIARSRVPLYAAPA